MDVIRGDGKLLENIELEPENVHQEVVQNIAVILDLIQKSCPMFRDGGIPAHIHGRPMTAVTNMMVGYIYNQIEEYEPRAILTEVGFEEDGVAGTLVPIIKLEGVRE